jgi:hypothetical protein
LLWPVPIEAAKSSAWPEIAQRVRSELKRAPDETLVQAISDDFAQLLPAELLVHAAPISGAVETLHWLRERGIRHAMVSAGGDSRVIGSRRSARGEGGDRPWSVAIRHPRQRDGVVRHAHANEARARRDARRDGGRGARHERQRARPEDTREQRKCGVGGAIADADSAAHLFTHLFTHLFAHLFALFRADCRAQRFGT